MNEYRQRCADAAMKAWGEQAVLCNHGQTIPVGNLVDAVLAVENKVIADLNDLITQERTIHEQTIQEVALLRAELERRIDADAEALADQTLMRGLTVKDGAVNLDLIPPREIAAIWVHCAVGMLGDAPNYTETEVKMPSVSMEISPAGTLDRYALIVQRVGRLTPHEARQAAEARAEQAAAALADLNWLIAAGVHVTIGAVDHNGGADLCVALDLEDEPDDNPAWYGPLGESLADARAHCAALEIGP